MESFFSIVSKVSRYGLWLGFTFSFPPYFPVIGRLGRGAPNLKHDLNTVKSKFQVVEVQEVAETGLHKFYKN